MSKYIAVAQIEQVVKGNRTYAEPGSVVNLPNSTSRDKDEIAFFLGRKAIRELNKQELELEGLREKSAAHDNEDHIEDPDDSTRLAEEQKKRDAAAIAAAEANKSVAQTKGKTPEEIAEEARLASAAVVAGNGKVVTADDKASEAAAAAAAVAEANKTPAAKAKAKAGTDDDI